MSSVHTAGAGAGRQLISARQLAAMLNVSLRTLWRWRSNGRLIQPLRIGGATRWRLDEVESWIADGCPPPKGDKQ